MATRKSNGGAMKEANRVGRPTLPKWAIKSTMVPVRFDAWTKRRIAAAAKVAGKSVSAWIRAACQAGLVE